MVTLKAILCIIQTPLWKCIEEQEKGLPHHMKWSMLLSPYFFVRMCDCVPKSIVLWSKILCRMGKLGLLTLFVCTLYWVANYLKDNLSGFRVMLCVGGCWYYVVCAMYGGELAKWTTLRVVLRSSTIFSIVIRRRRVILVWPTSWLLLTYYLLDTWANGYFYNTLELVRYITICLRFQVR